MIDFSTLKFGDKVYNINTNIHAFHRKKITTIVDGVEWYRYDKPSRTYTIEEFTYVGRSESHVFGEVIPEDVDDTKHFIRNTETKEMSYLYDDSADDSDWFTTKAEAEQEVKDRIEDDKQTDRS